MNTTRLLYDKGQSLWLDNVTGGLVDNEQQLGQESELKGTVGSSRAEVECHPIFVR